MAVIPTSYIPFTMRNTPAFTMPFNDVRTRPLQNRYLQTFSCGWHFQKIPTTMHPYLPVFSLKPDTLSCKRRNRSIFFTRLSRHLNTCQQTTDLTNKMMKSCSACTPLSNLFLFRMTIVTWKMEKQSFSAWSSVTCCKLLRNYSQTSL